MLKKSLSIILLIESQSFGMGLNLPQIGHIIYHCGQSCVEEVSKIQESQKVQEIARQTQKVLEQHARSLQAMTDSQEVQGFVFQTQKLIEDHAYNIEATVKYLIEELERISTEIMEKWQQMASSKQLTIEDFSEQGQNSEIENEAKRLIIEQTQIATKIQDLKSEFYSIEQQSLNEGDMNHQEAKNRALQILAEAVKLNSHGTEIQSRLDQISSQIDPQNL